MQRSQNYFFILTLKVVSPRQLFVKSTFYYSSRLVASRSEENPWKPGSSFFIFFVWKFFREHFPLNREIYRILFRLLLIKYFLFISYDLSLVILFVLFTLATQIQDVIFLQKEQTILRKDSYMEEQMQEQMKGLAGIHVCVSLPYMKEPSFVIQATTMLAYGRLF